MKSAELCAGYGGLALAIEEVFDAETAWVSEFEPAPSKILAHHWPDAPNYGDMTTINWYGVEPVDVLGAGTPCQDLSTAGRRRGMTEGTRSNLAVEFLRAVEIIKPTYVVWENVRGAYSAKADSDLEHCPGCMGDTTDERVVLRALGRLLGSLSDLGYDTQWRGLRAADVGACHGRFRVFVLARLREATHDSRSVRRLEAVQHHGRRTATDDGAGVPNESDCHAMWTGSLGEVTPRRDGLGHERAGDSRGRWTRLEDDGQPAPDACSSAIREHSGEPSAEEAGPLGCDGSCDSCGERHAGHWREAVADAASARRAEREDRGAGGSNASQRSRSIEPERAGSERIGVTTDTLSGGCPRWAREARRETLDGTAPERPGEGVAWGEYEPAIRRWERVLGRRAPRPTEPTGRNNGHRLSPRFTEWMMGLPDGWVTDPAIGISRNEQLKACGNGVVPQQAIAALSDMLAAFNRLEAAA